VVDCMQQSFEGLQTAATAKFGWRMKHTGISSTPRNDRLLHIDYLWIAGCSIQDRPTLCVHAIVLGMQMGQSYQTQTLTPSTHQILFGFRINPTHSVLEYLFHQRTLRVQDKKRRRVRRKKKRFGYRVIGSPHKTLHRYIV